MRYAEARFKENQREEAYRIYISDCMQLMVKNTANIVGGTIIEKRYIDIVNEKSQVETKTQQEIIDGIKNKLRKGG